MLPVLQTVDITAETMKTVDGDAQRVSTWEPSWQHWTHRPAEHWQLDTDTRLLSACTTHVNSQTFTTTQRITWLSTSQQTLNIIEYSMSLLLCTWTSTVVAHVTSHVVDA